MIDDVRHDWVVHDINQTRLNPRNDAKIYYFARISLIPPRISFNPFATYLVDFPLSITNVKLWVRCIVYKPHSSNELKCIDFTVHLNCPDNSSVFTWQFTEVHLILTFIMVMV